MRGLAHEPQLTKMASSARRWRRTTEIAPDIGCKLWRRRVGRRNAGPLLPICSSTAACAEDEPEAVSRAIGGVIDGGGGDRDIDRNGVAHPGRPNHRPSVRVREQRLDYVS